MAVTVIFNTTVSLDKPQLSAKDAIAPTEVLFLRGKELVDAHGRIVAELVQDRDSGQFLWSFVGTINDPAPFLPSMGTDLKKHGLFQELAIIGQGRLHV